MRNYSIMIHSLFGELLGFPYTVVRSHNRATVLFMTDPFIFSSVRTDAGIS